MSKSPIGCEYKTYLASYNYEGERWNLEIKARDFADAQARLNRLSFATLDGEVKGSIPMPRGRIGVLLSSFLGAIQDSVFSSRSG